MTTVLSAGTPDGRRPRRQESSCRGRDGACVRVRSVSASLQTSEDSVQVPSMSRSAVRGRVTAAARW